MVDWSKYKSLVAGPDEPLNPQEVKEFEKEHGPLAKSLLELCQFMTESDSAEEHYASDRKAELALKIWSSAKSLRQEIRVVTQSDDFVERVLSGLYHTFFTQDSRDAIIKTDKWKPKREKCKKLGEDLDHKIWWLLWKWDVRPDREQFAWLQKAYGPLAEDLSCLADILREADRVAKSMRYGLIKRLFLPYLH